MLQCRNLRTSIAASSSKFDCWFGNLAAFFAADLTVHFQYSVSLRPFSSRPTPTLRGAPFNSLFFYILRSITSFQPPFFISHPSHRLKYRLSFQCAWISRAILTYTSLGWNNKHIAANNPADLFQAVTISIQPFTTWTLNSYQILLVQASLPTSGAFLSCQYNSFLLQKQARLPFYPACSSQLPASSKQRSPGSPGLQYNRYGHVFQFYLYSR